MNQFKHAWNFAFNNWQYFLILAAPVMAVEIATASLISPMQNVTQPEDLMTFINDNGTAIGTIGILGMLLSISFIGGLFVSYNAKEEGIDIEPLSALLAGFKKFFPILGAYLFCALVLIIPIFLGMLIMGPIALALIPLALYIAGRFSLFPSLIMLENKGITDSLDLSWKRTDEHGGTLFGLTLLFFSITMLAASVVQSLLVPGIAQYILLGLVEYIIVIPWGYVYFSLYRSFKTQ
ncbi:hypothetical protein N9R58_03850 [Gammaproteobacteria bacterium]|nr:hypothetical protein [Gammaproteobacteria bacterium]